MAVLTLFDCCNCRYSLDDHYRQETGDLKRIGDAAVYVVTGTYGYVGADGEHHKVNYVADENGFRILPMVEIGDRIDINLKKSLLGLEESEKVFRRSFAQTR